MRIYTRTGDKGETSLFGGKRVKKHSLRVEAYGCVDELNSFIGLARSFNKDNEIDSIIENLQQDLFTIGADLATPLDAKTPKPIKRVSKNQIDDMEKAIDKIWSRLKPLKGFVLPAGTITASCLHVARAVCRRSERAIIALSEKEEINNHVVPYVNRLSALLFVLALLANQNEGVSETPVK